MLYEHFIDSKGDNIDHNKKEEAYQLILLRAMMAEEELSDKAEFQFLTVDEIKEILSFYTNPPKLLRVEKK